MDRVLFEALAILVTDTNCERTSLLPICVRHTIQPLLTTRVPRLASHCLSNANAYRETRGRAYLPANPLCATARYSTTRATMLFLRTGDGRAWLAGIHLILRTMEQVRLGES